MAASYDIDKIKFGVGEQEFNKAVALYEGRNVTKIREDSIGYGATVLGTQPYHVYVHKKTFDRGMCECYLGENDTLCKHMLALAIHAVQEGKPLSLEERETAEVPTYSGKLGELSKEELSLVKKQITGAIRYIKYYEGPSRTWFAYQNSLDEGCRRLSTIFSNLPASEQVTKLIVDTLLRIDNRISTGVDDSNGIVGNFIVQSVWLLVEFAKADQKCKESCEKLHGKETSFGWEEILFEELDNKK